MYEPKNIASSQHQIRPAYTGYLSYFTTLVEVKRRIRS